MKKYFLIFFLGLCHFICLAQPDKRSNIWYFGEKAGLDFSSGSPTALTDGAMTAQFGGISTICDENGQLVMYSDGKYVWNRYHRIIPGAENLINFGEALDVIRQNGLLFTHRKNPDYYYVFSTERARLFSDAENIYYAIIDSKMNAGEGGIVSKSNILAKNVANTIEIVQHCNNHDFWVITHELGSNNFLSYLVDDSGINTSPIVSSVGSTLDDVNDGGRRGFLRASFDGKLLAMARPNGGTGTNANFVEVFSFDNKTGTVQQQIHAQTWLAFRGGITPSDMVFSGNGNFLYVTHNFYPVFDIPNNKFVFQTDLFQINLTQNSSLTLLATDLYDPAPNSSIECFGLQMGIDSKIYVSYSKRPYLSVINDPNTDGIACNFQLNAINLNGRNAGLYLPHLMPPKKPDAKVSINLKTNNNGCNDIIESKVSGFDATQNLLYQWYFEANSVKNATNPTYDVLKSGKYYLIVQEANGCIIEKSNELNITVKNVFLPPSITFIKPICIGNKTPPVLANGTQIRWYEDNKLTKLVSQNASFVPLINTSTAGKYTFYATQTSLNNCVSPPDSVEITINPNPKIEISSRIMAICLKNIIENPELSISVNENVSYLWTFNNTAIGNQSKVKVSDYGKYYVSVTNQNICVAKDSISIVDACYQLFIPNAFTPNEDNINDQFTIVGNGIVTYDAYIFNRWGELVFSSKNTAFKELNIVWDGKSQGVYVPNGEYAYVIDAKILIADKESVITKKGVIRVFR